MEIYVEAQNPARDLGGLCECFMAENTGLCILAAPHVHRYFELLYCLSGGYELTVDNQSYALNPGDVALVHPMEPHQTRTLTQGKNSYQMCIRDRPVAGSNLRPSKGSLRVRF